MQSNLLAPGDKLRGGSDAMNMKACIFRGRGLYYGKKGKEDALEACYSVRIPLLLALCGGKRMSKHCGLQHI